MANIYILTINWQLTVFFFLPNVLPLITFIKSNSNNND